MKLYIFTCLPKCIASPVNEDVDPGDAELWSSIVLCELGFSNHCGSGSSSDEFLYFFLNLIVYLSFSILF